MFHSEWWIREHWGRVFDVLFLERHDPAEATEGQGATLLRRRQDRLAAKELERAADEPRELAAARQNLEQLRWEAAELFAHLSAVTDSHAALTQNVEDLRLEIERLRAELATIARSRSWRLTAPLRAATAVLRRRSA